MPFDGMVIRPSCGRNSESVYVCPRLQDLDKVKEGLRTFVPEATFCVAHGQMPASELEEVMTRMTASTMFFSQPTFCFQGLILRVRIRLLSTMRICLDWPSW